MERLKTSPMLLLLILLLLRNISSGRYGNPSDFIYDTLIFIPGIVLGLSLHEFGHAISSYKLGDPTPKVQGRVTVNPLAHIDPMGFIALIICGFGWGRPVEINPRNYKHPRRDELIVSLAGVTINLLLAILFSLIIRFYIKATGTVFLGRESGIPGIVLEILLYVVQINLVLMIFNLIPVPPLDGFGVITQLFNLRNTKWYYRIYQYGYPILMVLLITGAVSKILSPLVGGLLNLLLKYVIF